MGKFLAVLTSLAICTSAQASHQGSWSLGGGIGQAFPTGPSLFFDSQEKKLHGSLWLRHQLGESFGLELNVQSLKFGSRVSGGTDGDETGYTLNAVCVGDSHGKWNTVAALGAGLGEIKDYATDKYSELYALARYGVEYHVTDALNLGGHLQMNYSPKSSGTAPSEIHALSYLLAVGYTFGAQSPAHASEPAAPVAAAAPPVKELDSDHDGVPDSLDKCPGTPAGAKVNAYGCQETEKAQVSLNVTFPAGKAVVEASQKPQLEGVAKFLKEFPSTKVVIEGHTDKTGNEASNKKLSQARADAVRNSLVKDFGIEAGRLSAQGFGSSSPIADNKTAEGRAKNRRVIATISEK